MPDVWPRKMHKKTTLYSHYMLVHGKEEHGLLKRCSERVWLGGHAPGGKIQGFDFNSTLERWGLVVQEIMLELELA